jgi:hypothetical protein
VFDLPAFIETEPGSFKPLEECSTAELGAAAETMMAHAVMSMHDAVDEADAHGGVTPASQEMARKSEDEMRQAEALATLAELRPNPN